MRAPTNRISVTTLRRGVAELVAGDHRLGAIVASYGPPPLWQRPGGFRTIARIVLEQQVSLRSAATLIRRLERSIPGLSAAGVSAQGVAGLRRLGVTRQKSDYLATLAERVESGALDLRGLTRLQDDEARERLLLERGIGPWSAGIYLLMALGRPDIWPPGDLALHLALARLRRQRRTPTSDEAARYAERWRPWRSVAARILWHGYLAMRSTRVPVVT